MDLKRFINDAYAQRVAEKRDELETAVKSFLTEKSLRLKIGEPVQINDVQLADESYLSAELIAAFIINEDNNTLSPFRITVSSDFGQTVYYLKMLS